MHRACACTETFIYSLVCSHFLYMEMLLQFIYFSSIFLWAAQQSSTSVQIRYKSKMETEYWIGNCYLISNLTRTIQFSNITLTLHSLIKFLRTQTLRTLFFIYYIFKRWHLQNIVPLPQTYYQKTAQSEVTHTKQCYQLNH